MRSHWLFIQSFQQGFNELVHFTHPLESSL
jgi:hypothetical protein